MTLPQLQLELESSSAIPFYELMGCYCLLLKAYYTTIILLILLWIAKLFIWEGTMLFAKYHPTEVWFERVESVVTEVTVVTHARVPVTQTFQVGVTRKSESTHLTEGRNDSLAINS
jgi:hypothetical protein